MISTDCITGTICTCVIVPSVLVWGYWTLSQNLHRQSIVWKGVPLFPAGHTSSTHLPFAGASTRQTSGRPVNNSLEMPSIPDELSTPVYSVTSNMLQRVATRECTAAQRPSWVRTSQMRNKMIKVTQAKTAFGHTDFLKTQVHSGCSCT